MSFKHLLWKLTSGKSRYIWWHLWLLHVKNQLWFVCVLSALTKTCILVLPEILNCPWVWVSIVSATVWTCDLSRLVSCLPHAKWLRRNLPPVTLFQHKRQLAVNGQMHFGSFKSLKMVSSGPGWRLGSNQVQRGGITFDLCNSQQYRSQMRGAMVPLTAQSVCVIVKANICTITSPITAPSGTSSHSVHSLDARAHTRNTAGLTFDGFASKCSELVTMVPAPFTWRRVGPDRLWHRSGISVCSLLLMVCPAVWRTGAHTCWCQYPNYTQIMMQQQHMERWVLWHQLVINPNMLQGQQQYINLILLYLTQNSIV